MCFNVIILDMCRIYVAETVNTNNHLKQLRFCVDQVWVWVVKIDMWFIKKLKNKKNKTKKKKVEAMLTETQWHYLHPNTNLLCFCH